MVSIAPFDLTVPWALVGGRNVVKGHGRPLVLGAPTAACADMAVPPAARADVDGVRRGFTTLSALLGKMAVCTHEALLQALSSEAAPAALAAVLRFAGVLFGMTPYQRLPLTLLPGILQVRALFVSCDTPQLHTQQWQLSAAGSVSTMRSRHQPDSSMRL